MNVAFACEPLTADLLREAIPLLREHWAEVSHYQDIPLDVDVEGYLTAASALRCYTVRIAPNVAEFVVPHAGYEGDLDGAPVGGYLVGYALFVVRPNLHYKQSLQSVQDVLYLHPSVRGGTGARFIAYCDEQLQAEGVQAVYHHAKHAHPQLGNALVRLGYEPVETIYAKRLDAVAWNPATINNWQRAFKQPRVTQAEVLVVLDGETPRRRWSDADETNDLARTRIRSDYDSSLAGAIASADTLLAFSQTMQDNAAAWTGEDGG